ncbi:MULTISPECIES: ribosome biogenesis GTPase YlqF [unclassified Enterococcus]|uniref:ribosome biogenesis GTPase YlqF n=1 Tax=unclassified Enterococcus TaxID=2608891 RepID=UPI0015548F24|nr:MULTISPECIES: ribosome biogenesis GTPase YlqF [unclassified Enterococcus]MBS7576511.1 ribosome biogenesis GTPase YlqF [Enterococcus sp. MMGLQ5-2]MBS7585596.1 ribosome biogenesis GTPase YlqF [Enterococcus sp. MMGLQ5-1]NPD13455.1 ribosome biogenesis GTPase YlqF [Enterococcus sp. MMGLQ5-1]NPD36348.1 ribosome biogenesis GTPase YlqF [Enterococcus sp. MMGLQ5-2]
MSTIQWFPGHMNKARRQVQENLKYVDVIFELADARIPVSSRNPMLDKIINQKPRLLLLNKIDLADPEKVKAWRDYFSTEGLKALEINSKEQQTVKKVVQATQGLLKEKIERDQARGIQPRALRAMIIGIPNAGKSTLMNRISGKKTAVVGNKPGVTKGQQWIRLNADLELLDTPGILWPKFDDELVGLKLAATGAIKDDLLHFDEVVIFVLDYFKKHYPTVLLNRFKLETTDLDDSSAELIMKLSQKLGFKDDYDRFYQLFIKELRDGKLGRYTLDDVEQMTNDNGND